MEIYSKIEMITDFMRKMFYDHLKGLDIFDIFDRKYKTKWFQEVKRDMQIEYKY